MVENLSPGDNETKGNDVTQLSNEWEYVDKYGTEKSITITNWEDMHKNKKEALGMILLDGLHRDVTDGTTTLETLKFEKKKCGIRTM